MNCKKIALINGSLCGGGAERFTANFANAIEKDSIYNLFLITAEKKEDEYELVKGIKRFCILSESFIKDLYTIRKFLIKNKINTAIGIGIYANLLLCSINFFLKTTIIISERNDPKHDNLSIISKVLRKLLYWRSDKYVFQTEGAKSFYSNSIQKRSVVIHNPVKENLPIKSTLCKKEIIAVGRLMPQKNYPLLINAFTQVSKHYPDYILRIFGKGLLLNELKVMADKLGISNKVIFEGFCTNIHEEIKDSDIFVLSSDFEGMPNSLIEAMAMGFLVISTDCPSGGPSELITNGVNGLLVKTDDVKSLSNAILTLINNEEFKQKIANSAKHLRATHSMDFIISKWKDIL